MSVNAARVKDNKARLQEQFNGIGLPELNATLRNVNEQRIVDSIKRDKHKHSSMDGPHNDSADSE